MAKSQQTYSKNEREKKKIKKREEKAKKKEERKNSPQEDMFAYVDEYGNLTSTPPDPSKKIKVEAENIEIGVPKREEMEEEDPIRKGKITFFNESKGYGFIKDLSSQESIFVHINGLEEDVKEGDKVTFEVEQGKKGLNAVRVKQDK